MFGIRPMSYLIAILAFSQIGFGQSQSVVAGKRLNIAYTQGTVDYVDLEKVNHKAPAKVFGYYNDPRARSRPNRNMESFALNFRGWVLLDEYIVDPEFYWELDPRYLHGKNKTVDFSKIAKYPSLVKRYKAIQPSSVNYIVCAEIESTNDVQVKAASVWSWQRICFRALGYQVLWGDSRNGKDKTYPQALLGWTEGVSTDFPTERGFTKRDLTDVKAIRNFLKNHRNVRMVYDHNNTWLDIRWPDDAIDKIADDFEKYEKEDKDLEKEYKEAKEEPNTAKRVQPIIPDSELAQPFEPAAKTATVFYDKTSAELGLVSPTGRKVFTSNKHSSGKSLDKEGRYFEFQLRSNQDSFDENIIGGSIGNRVQIYNAAGKVIKIEGYNAFNRIFPKDDGTSNIYIDTGGAETYRTVRCYYPEDDLYHLSPDGFASLRADDQAPLPPLGASRGGGLSLGFSRYHFIYKNALRVVVDSNYKVLSSGPGFMAVRKEPRSQERCSP